MKAAVCRSFGSALEIEEVTVRPPGRGEVSVRVTACAICHSDIAYIDGAWGGPLPAVYGHEAAGVVTETGPGVAGLASGDHVVVTLIRSCGRCASCLRDQPSLCDGLPVADASPVLAGATGEAIHQGMRTGAFAGLVTVDASQVVTVPPSVPLDAACLLACGVLTGVGAVMNTAAVEPGAAVVVLGAGGVGLNCVQGCVLAGAGQIIAVDPVPSKRAAARLFGATDVIDPARQDTVAAIMELTGGRGVDHVLVAAGMGSLIETGITLLRRGGSLVIVGLPPVGTAVSLDPLAIADGSLRVLGSKMGASRPARDIPQLIELYRAGRLKLDELISQRFELDRINDAIESARAGAQLRPVIVFPALPRQARMASMDVHGMAEPGVEPVRDCLAAVLDGQPGTGAAFAAWYDGRLVADLWGGYADAARTRPWEASSIVQPYSVSKPFAAVCVLHLAAQGRLQLDAPMQRYWPEFRAPATVRHVLAHQAGVVALDQPAPTGVFYDWDGLCRLLAAQAPAWEPGTAHGESALFYGHLTGELVRRVDGRSVGRYLREEICGPLGLDFGVGLGRPQQARAVELTGLDDAFRADSVAGKPPLFCRAMLNPPGALDPAVVNGAAWRTAEIPAVNGHGTARAVAGFYHALAAGQVLPPGLLAEAITPQRTGPDRVFGEEASWGLGFGIDGADYGMAGVGGSYGGTNTAGGYSIGYLTGRAGTFEPLATVENEFRRCLGLPALAD